MRLNLLLELQDVPGKLFDALEPMGRLGANIVTVIHQREVKTERGTVPVQVSIEGDQDTLDQVIKALEEKGIQIMAVDGVVRKETITTVLVGNIVDQDLKDTVNLLNKLSGVKVVDLNLKMSDHPEESATKLVIEADQGLRQEVMDQTRKIGEQKGLLVINEI